MGFSERIRKSYTAVVTGDGRVLPIVESLGRRLLREIDADSPEGRRLLAEGRVMLWADEGGRSGSPLRPRSFAPPPASGPGSQAGRRRPPPSPRR